MRILIHNFKLEHVYCNFTFFFGVFFKEDIGAPIFSFIYSAEQLRANPAQ